MLSKLCEFLFGVCVVLGLLFATAMDGDGWLVAVGFFLASFIAAYVFYRAAEWASDYENNRNKSKERRR